MTCRPGGIIGNWTINKETISGRVFKPSLNCLAERK